MGQSRGITPPHIHLFMDNLEAKLVPQLNLLYPTMDELLPTARTLPFFSQKKHQHKSPDGTFPSSLLLYEPSSLLLGLSSEEK